MRPPDPKKGLEYGDADALTLFFWNIDDFRTHRPMIDKFDKIKLSRHQQANLEDGVPGHDLTRDEAEEIIKNAVRTETQPDGRGRFWGIVGQKPYRVVVSAVASAVTSVGRVVTAHRSRTPKE